MKYLYYYGRNDNRYAYRVPVTRETKDNIWIKTNNSETMISKKTYRTGSTWNFTHYYEETPELLDKYNNAKIFHRFNKTLDFLKTITDFKEMDDVSDMVSGYFEI